ncbi:MAG: SRPBCC family protein, partial [Chloroflexota bacterium]
MKKLGKIALWGLGGVIVIIGLLSVIMPTSIHIHLKEEVNASPDAVWAVVAHQFAEVGEWAPNIEWSRAVASDEVPSQFTVAPSAPVSGRVTPNPLGDLTEVFIEYSEPDKTFTFDTAGLPPIIAHSYNTTQVTELDSGRS